MRRFALILLLLGMLMAVGILEAQEEENVIYFFCWTDDSELVTQENIELDINACPRLFTESLSHSLEALGYSLIFDQQQAETNGIELYLPLGMFSGTLVTILNIQDKGLPSPILYTHPRVSWSFANSYNLNDRENIAIGVELTTGMMLSISQRCEEATIYLENILDITSEYNDIERASFYLGNCALKMGEYETAFEIYQESLQMTAPNSFLGLYRQTINMAWILLELGKTNDSISLLENVDIPSDKAWLLSSIRQVSDFLARRAQIYALAFDYDSAIADMDEAIELAEENEADNTTLAELYTIRGEIIFLIYEWDRVLENFNHAIELDPDYAPAYFQRGVLYYTMTQRENALADFQHYLELEPDGLYAEEAAQYIESIEIELEALGG